MGRYIDADALKEALEKEYGKESPIVTAWLPYFFEKIPTADVAPVRHAHWIFNGTFGNLNHHSCSACLKDEFRLYRYCPNCGARMDG